MTRRILFLFLVLVLAALPFVWGITAVTGQSAAPLDVLSGETLIYVNRNAEGVLNVSNLSVFGPGICSANGDPFSPDLPNWLPLEESALYVGLYTYQFRIRIPADYPHDILRVELFDPDSMNQPNNYNGNTTFTANISHTQAWINSGRPAVTTGFCSQGSYVTRQNPCLIDTQEDELLGLPLDQVNPWWYGRIDENRRPRPSCDAGSAYNAAYNTQTAYELSYNREMADGSIVPIALARYTGQVGDGVRDDGSHLTDLHWVSPGAPMSFDQPADAPTSGPNAYPDDFGSFELSLSEDLVDIVTDPLTGDRFVDLGVRTFTGSSENGFMVWAGPPDYINTISSNVNTRNVQVINNPGSHSAAGVEVLAVNNLPANSNYGSSYIDHPLTYLGPEFAGEEVFVRLFDSDSGAYPPITFFLDSVAASDWSMVFSASSNPTNDPDHDPVTYPTNGRCRIGSCQNTWTRPAYKITIPTYDAEACAADPGNQYVCTPFNGGRLIARYKGGQDDTYGWQVNASITETPLDVIAVTGPTDGISAQSYAFTATITPVTATVPIIYTWQATEKQPVIYVGGASSQVSFNWATGGLKTITVTAANLHNQVTATHTITLATAVADLTIGPLELVSTPPITVLTPVTFRATISNTGNVNVNTPFLVDVFLDPTIVLTNSIPFSQSSGFQMVSNLAAGASRVVTITADAGFAPQPLTHTVYAMVDSLQQITEADESNNISGPLTVTAVLLPPEITLNPSCSNGGPMIDMHVAGSYWPVGEAVAVFWRGQLIQQVVPQNGSFDLYWTAANPGSGEHDVWAQSVSHSATAVFTIPCTPQLVTAVSLTGPIIGQTAVNHTFTAVITPTQATYPITYIWQIDNQPPITHTNWRSDSLAVAWITPGTHVVVVAAANEYNTRLVAARHVITIEPRWFFLPFVVKE